MDKLLKSLLKLEHREQKVARDLVDRAIRHDTSGLNVLKLRGYANLFRIRKGHIRVLYEVAQDGHVTIIKIDRRDDKTYKNLP